MRFCVFVDWGSCVESILFSTTAQAMSRRHSEKLPATDDDDDGVVDRSKYTRASWSINMDEKGKAVSETNLAELLTNQRWHEIGNGPPPISAS